jgi:hypothetical protein
MKVKPWLSAQIERFIGTKFVRPFNKSGTAPQGLGGIEIIFVGRDKHHVLRINLKKTTDTQIGLGVGLVMTEDLG